MPTDERFRANLRAVLTQTGLSMRALSAALGRDPGYIAALLDPTRPSRARPTPADLVRAADATGIPLVTLLEVLWDVPAARLASELAASGVGGIGALADERLTAADRASIVEFAAFLAAKHGSTRRRGRGGQ